MSSAHLIFQTISLLRFITVQHIAQMLNIIYLKSEDTKQCGKHCTVTESDEGGMYNQRFRAGRDLQDPIQHPDFTDGETAERTRQRTTQATFLG